MRWAARSGCVLVLGLWVVAPAFAEAADDGKTVYTKKCASCHGDKGEGKPAIAKAMKVELKHLGAPDIQKKSDAELAKNITDGVDKMKGVKGLSDGEVKAVVAYVRTLKP